MTTIIVNISDDLSLADRAYTVDDLQFLLSDALRSHGIGCHLTVLPTETDEQRIIQIIQESKSVLHAIKSVRSTFGFDLLTSKRIVEDLIAKGTTVGGKL